jgi:hypothetical protein
MIVNRDGDHWNVGSPAGRAMASRVLTLIQRATRSLRIEHFGRDFVEVEREYLSFRLNE